MKAVKNNRKWTTSIRKKWSRSLLILSFGLLSVAAQAQMSGKSIPEIKRILQSPIPRFQLASLHISTFQLFSFSTPQPTPIHLSTYFFNTDIPNLHKYEHLPFFCKMEVKMERAAKFPIKFRLGDVPYVDYLEGKRDTKY